MNPMRLTHPLFILLFSLSLSHTALATDDTRQQIRFATFNIAMGLESEGELYQRLKSG